MDLIRLDGVVIVAGPDTAATTSVRGAQPTVGLRFKPGVLPRLLGVPASELRDTRVALAHVRPVPGSHSLIGLATALAAERRSGETAPWTLPLLDHVTGSLAAGASVSAVAQQVGVSNRSLQRQCGAVYGYGPALLRRVLRFRHAVTMLRAGAPFARVAADAGFSDQPHLHREVRALAGVSLGQLASGANRSTDVPSGSATVA
jgi:AraC-like DNA-binding protein